MKEFTMEGLRVACIYGIGHEVPEIINAGSILANFVLWPRPEKKEKVCKVLERLEFFSACDTLGDLLNKPPFDEEVLTTYFLGSELGHIREISCLCHNFEVIQKIKKMMAEDSLNAGTGQLPFDCLISSGKVIEVYNNSLKVINERLLFNPEDFSWQEEEREIKRGFVGQVGLGDVVSIHLGVARQNIGDARRKRLKETTVTAISFLMGRKRKLSLSS